MKQKMSHKQDLLMKWIKSFQLSSALYMESLFFLFGSRKDLSVDINANFTKFNTLTSCLVIIFFSYVENTAISIKRLMIRALDGETINISSKKQYELVHKDEDKLSFEDMMKLTFSVFPSSFGAGNYYGDIKNRDLKTLSLLREIRNIIIHPKEMEDIFVSLKKLGGKDINLPMMNYMNAVKNLIKICAKKTGQSTA